MRISLSCCVSSLMVLALVAAPSEAQLWYNGDPDGRDGLANISGGQFTKAEVFDNFNVPAGSQWTVTSLFSVDSMNYKYSANAAEIHWEIRSGVSSGNSGTLVASGDTTTGTQVAETNSGGNFDNYKLTVSGLSLTLAAGQYYLDVTPTLTSGDTGGNPGAYQSFLQTTSGLNAIGTPPGNDGNSYTVNTGFGQNFTTTTDSSNLGPGTWDFSMGVNGVSTLIGVPEPGSLVLLATAGSLAVVFRQSRRRRKS